MSLAELLAPVWAELGSIKKRLPSVSAATVTSVVPVRIQVDGQSAPVAASPDTLVPVGPGDRVRVLRYGTTHLILGRINTAGQPWRQAVGLVDVTISNDIAGTATITFPPDRFTVPPLVFASVTNNTRQYVAPSVATSNTDYAVVQVRRIDGTTVTETLTVAWHAIQMTPTSAEG